MISKQVKEEIGQLQTHIRIKKERIAKLNRLAKLNKNADLISEYDAIVKQAEDSIFAILDSKELLDAHNEQVILRSSSKVRLMAKGLKSNLCEADKQIEWLNNSVEDDNIRISELEKSDSKGTTGGII